MRVFPPSDNYYYVAGKDPLIPLLGALALGIYSSHHLLFDPLPVACGLAALLLLTLLSHWRSTPRATYRCTLAGILLFGSLLEIHHRPNLPPVIEFDLGETLVLAGCVVEPPALSEDREQFVIEIDRAARVRINFYLKEGELPPDLHYGQRVELEGRLRKPRNYLNPGAFDFVSYLAKQDIYWLASAGARSRLQIHPGACGNPLLALIYTLREKAVARLDRLYAGNDYADGMTRAILIGDTARMQKVWIEDFRRTGTYHALVISGMHIAVLIMTFLFFLRLLSVGVGWSLICTSLVAWIYALMAGGGAPVVRSAAGLSLYWVCMCLYRKPRVLNLLAAVGLAFLIYDPNELFDPSFQLSFLAVAMIGAFASPLLASTSDPYHHALRRLGDSKRDIFLAPKAAQFRVELRLLAETLLFLLRLPQRATIAVFSLTGRALFYIWSLFIISAVVQMGLTLPMVSYFHRLSLTGLTANLVIVPLMNTLVPVGFLAIFTGWTAPAWFANVLLDAARRVAEWHAAHEPALRIPDPPYWLFAAFILMLILLWRNWRLGLIPFAAAFLLLVLHPFPQQTPSGWLEVTAIDVGQGDSILVCSPEGKLMLIDAGGFLAFGSNRKPTLDIGEDVVSPYLFTRSIKQLDIVVATHAHEDHIGGLKAVVDNFHPREIWSGASPIPFPAVYPKGGEKRDWGGVQIEFLSPPAGYLPNAKTRNNDSLAFRITYRNSSFLFTGDMERPMERLALSAGLLQPADVLKVAHHGSRTSTIPEFLGSVRPRFALISDGEGNSFNHPHPSVVERLSQRGTQILRTDRQGQITIRTDGRHWQVETFRLRN